MITELDDTVATPAIWLSIFNAWQTATGYPEWSADKFHLMFMFVPGRNVPSGVGHFEGNINGKKVHVGANGVASGVVVDGVPHMTFWEMPRAE